MNIQTVHQQLTGIVNEMRALDVEPVTADSIRAALTLIDQLRMVASDYPDDAVCRDMRVTALRLEGEAKELLATVEASP